MNILVVTHYQGDGSPCANFVHNQVKAYNLLGHNVRVLAPIAVGKCSFQASTRFSSLQREFDDIWYFHMRYFSLSNLGENGFNTKSAIVSLQSHLSLIFDGFQPDVIHAHTIGFDSEIGAWLKKKLGIPLVVTTHGSDTSVPYMQGNFDFLKKCCDQADAVVAVSSALKQKVLNCDVKSPSYVILNGFNVEYIHSNIKKDERSIIQVGNLIPQKKNDVTIKAFCKLKNNYPKMQLTIIGDGPERQRLELLCEKLGVKDSVSFLGRVSNEKVLQEMNKSQFFVMPSKPEGFGIVYLEAMASGCITIGTQGEGISDLIVSGENGFLVPADDVDSIVNVIDKVLNDKTLSDKIIANAKKDVENLTWRDNAEKYVELFWRLKQ